MTFCLPLGWSKRRPPNQSDARREKRPIPAELRSRPGIGRDRPRFGAKDRFSRTDRIGSERPHDLHVVRFSESHELIRRQRAERDVRLPGSRDRADDDFAFRDVCQHSPAEGLHLCQQPAWPEPVVGSGAEDQLTRPDDGSHD
jgi:hypothetical protein